MKEKELPSGITEAMIAEAKQKYGEDKIRFVEVLTEDGSAVDITVLAVVPSRTVTGQYRRFADTDPKKADEVLVKACLLSHKDQVLADDGLFYGVLNGIAN